MKEKIPKNILFAENHKVEKFVTVQLFLGKREILIKILMYNNLRPFAFLDKI